MEQEIKSHIGLEAYKVISNILKEPCIWWDVATIKTLMKSENHQRIWQEMLTKWKAFMTPHIKNGIEDEEEEDNNVTWNTLIDLSNRWSPYTSVGYSQVGLSRQNMIQEHHAHYSFRNEWWLFHLFHTETNDSIVGHIHRHTLIPPELWTLDGELESVIHISLSYSHNGKTYVDDVGFIPQRFGVSTISTQKQNNHFFQIKQGHSTITSVYSDTLFPLRIQWFIEEQPIQLLLDSVKPMVLMNNNGCLKCSDGIGVKHYIYPQIKGDDWEGFWEHLWESSVYPKGLADSTWMRAVLSIEDHWKPGLNQEGWNMIRISDWSLQEQWLLYTKYEIESYDNVTSYAIHIDRDGTTKYVSSENIKMSQKQNNELIIFLFSDPIVVQKQQHTTHHSMYMNTETYKHASRPLFVYITKSDDQQNHTRIEPTHESMITSYLLWIIPLLFVVVLLTLCIIAWVYQVKRLGFKGMWKDHTHLKKEWVNT